MKIVLASSNQGKIKEINDMLQRHNVVVVPQSDYQVPDVDETGLTFIENAILKARHACAHTGLPAIADDSGLEIDYLNGAPGIYSARYAGEHGNNQANNQKVLAQLLDVPVKSRAARFRCVMVLLLHEKDPSPVICEGIWDGQIAFEVSGTQGFGYDPIFYVPTESCTAAELKPEVKHTLSHRGQAMKKLLTYFQR
ncbi:MAG: non-canonical purine NTP pyrophosphatase, RdgB/HAM1 family [Legionellales bacterium]|nr:non-canonical purine NTP pyrophosphatase, RdgB/HAM1 family [Legionellales bacterium]|tara:strand:- start:1142 stop:1729 length:588 start_codon:yes stop_codon:yes gene_type:complete